MLSSFEEEKNHADLLLNWFPEAFSCIEKPSLYHHFDQEMAVAGAVLQLRSGRVRYDVRSYRTQRTMAADGGALCGVRYRFIDIPEIDSSTGID